MADMLVRLATRDDLEAVLALLGDKSANAGRERSDQPISAAELTAWEEMAVDARQLPIVAEQAGRLVGYLQLTLIPGLAHGGMKQGLVGAFRVASDRPGDKVGRALIGAASAHARNAGCRILRFMPDEDGDYGFYERLGLEATRTGFKQRLD